MGIAALLLVLLSAVAHVYWNLQVKRSAEPVAFGGLVQALSAAMALLAAWVLGELAHIPTELWIFVAASGALYALYYTLVALSYVRGDLSSGYPIARGLGPAATALLGIGLLGERPSAVGAAGIAMAVVGVLSVAWPDLRGGLRAGTALVAAAGTGLCIAGYSLVDKTAMGIGSPVTYLGLSFGVGAAVQGAALRVRGVAGLPRAEWAAAAAASLACAGGYLLILHLLQSQPVSYVVPARSVAVLLSVAVGGRLLGEEGARRRWPGAALIVAGVASIGLG